MAELTLNFSAVDVAGGHSLKAGRHKTIKTCPFKLAVLEVCSDSQIPRKVLLHVGNISRF